ncbi:MAG: hypothetical protein ACI308_08115 [Muribaculaceae bacterium]
MKNGVENGVMILLKGEPKTLQIEEIIGADRNHWAVRFKNNPQFFKYNKARVYWLYCPFKVEMESDMLKVNGVLLKGVKQAWRFVN